jgi:hypothetical protein
VAPALHSFNLYDRSGNDALHIAEVLVHSHVDLTKLVLKGCEFAKRGTAIFHSLVAKYPDLESLTLENFHPIRPAHYRLIARLKRLSELKLASSEVLCVYVKLLQTHVCICEHMEQNVAILTFYIFMIDENLKRLFEDVLCNTSFVFNKLSYMFTI